MNDDTRAIVPPRPDATAIVAAPGSTEPEINAVETFEARLRTANSRRACKDSLKRILRVLGYPEDVWRDALWHRLPMAKAVKLPQLLLDNYGLGTARLALSMLRGVLRASWRLGFIDRDSVERLTAWGAIIGEVPQAGRQLKDEEIARLRTHASIGKAPFLAARDDALLALAVGAGLRREELARLPVANVMDDVKMVRVLGKRNKVRDVPLPDWASNTIEAWLAQRELADLATEALFVDVRKIDGKYEARARPMSKWQVWRVLTQIGARAGVKFTPHDLRRTYISEELDNTDVINVSKLVGHEDPRTTARYDRRPERARRKAVEALEKWGKKA